MGWCRAPRLGGGIPPHSVPVGELNRNLNLPRFRLHPYAVIGHADLSLSEQQTAGKGVQQLHCVVCPAYRVRFADGARQPVPSAPVFPLLFIVESHRGMRIPLSESRPISQAIRSIQRVLAGMTRHI